MTAQEITYDWLVKNSVEHGYTDHIPHFKKLFELMFEHYLPTTNFFECGVGFSTKYFIDNCAHVSSVEFITPQYGPKWMEECQQLYAGIKNWTPIMYNVSDEVYKAANYQMSQHKDYARVDDTYVRDLKMFLHIETTVRKYDVAFVDPGIYLRGDMAELLLQLQIPVVAAHDVNMSNPDNVSLYGWQKIKSTADYEYVFVSRGAGTGFWISKELPEVIKGMKEYAELK